MRDELGQVRNLQSVIHLDKRALCLFEEAEDDSFRELALFVLVVHLENLVKGALIDEITEVD